MSNQTPPKPKRIAAITIAGWILFIAALINLANGLDSMFESDLLTNNPSSVVILTEDATSHEDQLTPHGINAVQGITDLFLGIVQLGISIGFWRQHRWAWVTAMSWQALKLLFEIANVLNNRAIVGDSEATALRDLGTALTILFAALLVFLLNQNQVRQVFNIQPPENESSSSSVRTLDVN